MLDLRRRGVHHAARRRGSGLAACGKSAAATGSGDRVSQRLGACRCFRARYLTAFQQGVRETGYVEGQNVAIEYRWAQDQYDRLPDLAADLVRSQVAVIAAQDTRSAIVAKAATTTIPIVFVSGGDPVKLGLVSSLNRPGGNVTGVTLIVVDLGAKRLGLLHELQPEAVRVGVLVDPNFVLTRSFVSEVQAAALSIGKQIEVLEAPTGRDIDTAFAGLAQKPIDALFGRSRPVAQQPSRTTGSAGGLPQGACNLSLARGRRSRRPDELRNEHHPCKSPGRRVHRPGLTHSGHSLFKFAVMHKAIFGPKTW